MSIPGNANPLLLASAAADAAAAGPIKSVRFNDNDSAHLTRTPSSAGNRRTWSWAAWVKRTKLGSEQALFNAWSDNSNRTITRFSSGDQLQFLYQSGGTFYGLTTVQVFRDPSAWIHVVFVLNTSDSTEADRAQIYINGSRIADGDLSAFSTGKYPPQNTEYQVNSTIAHHIGARKESSAFTSTYLNGYLADIHFVDGSALDATSFGAFDDNGVWQAAAYSGTFGTNGFHLLDFANESTVGHDSSGNENDFTANNITNVEANNTDGIDNVSNITQVQNNGTNVTVNLANLRTMMNTSTFQDADTDNSTYGVRVSGGKKFAVKWSNLTGLTSVSVRWQRASTYDASVQTTGTGITTATTSVTSSRRQDTFSTSSTTGQIVFEDVTSGSTNGFFIRAIEFKGYGSVTYPTNVENFTFPNADQDVLFDVPTNGTQSDTGAGGEVSGNYCTLNALYHGSTMSNGNLDYVSGAANIKTVQAVGTVGVSSGKYYFEVTCTASSGSYTDTWFIGLVKSDFDQDTTVYNQSNNVLYYGENGNKYVNSSGSSYGASYTDDDVIGVAADLTGNTIEFFKNGSSQGSISYTFSGTYLPYISNGDDSSSVSATLNFGQRAFAYSAPSGYKALCTTNLPTPTIADGSAQFEATTYAGNSSTQNITGINHGPDLVWIKTRNDTSYHFLSDSVRGPNKHLASNATDAEGTDTAITAFNSDGFSLANQANVNSSYNYVAWTWNAGANSNKTYTVKVVSDSGNKYRFDDFGTSAVTLDLAEGSTYVFDQSDSSNSGHPLRFSTTSDGTHNSGSEYTTGVTTTGTPGSAGAKTTIVVGSGVATLYYYCSVHSGMGGQANTNSTAGSSNFDGSIQSTVKANPEAGFSVVTYTGTGSAATVGHGLNSAPSFYVVKRRDTADSWNAYHASLGATKYVSLNRTNAAATYSGLWNDTEPTNSVFSILNDVGCNASGGTYVAYCISPVAGYSSVGSYTGNGQSGDSGPFVHLGFRAKFILLKNADLSGSNWFIFDTSRNTFNVVDLNLKPNSSAVEETDSSGTLDIFSNGFKMRSSGTHPNGNGNTILYMAFAENPFSSNGGLAR